MTTSIDGAVTSLNVRVTGDEKLERLKRDIMTPGLKGPVVARKSRPVYTGCRGARLINVEMAGAMTLMDGAFRVKALGRKTNERVVTGEAIPKAPKPEPEPPRHVDRSKLPRRLFRKVVRGGGPETAA